MMSKKELWNVCIISCIGSFTFAYFYKDNLKFFVDGVIYYSAVLCLLLIPIVIGILKFKKKYEGVMYYDT